MPTLKITYFDIRGRAEVLRLACIVGGLEFEDDRFAFSQFQDIKPKTPYGAVPTMEIDGKVAVQTMAMLRYLGKLTKLYPECPEAALKVDEVIDTFVDFQHCIFRYRGDDKDKLREERVKLVENDIPRYIGGLEKRLEVIGGDGPWVVGNEMTIADFVVLTVMNNFKCGILDFVSPDALEGFPRLMASYKESMNHPKIVEWHKKHPIANVTSATDAGYKVTYFDFPGRAEALRLTLAIGKIPFEDERLLRHEFMEIRSGLPYRSLPSFTIDGRIYAQSGAILRYLGKVANIYPKDPKLALRVDEIIDTVIDFINGIEAVDKKDKVNDEKHMSEYLDTGIPRYLGGLERRIKTFGDGPWTVSSDITIADIGIYIIALNANAGAWDFFDMSRLHEYPRLMQAAEAVREHPSVTEWNIGIAEKAAAVKERRK